MVQTFLTKLRWSVVVLSSAAILVAVNSSAEADVFVGGTTLSFVSGSTPVSVSVSINSDTSLVNINLTGRSDGFYGVGFGGTNMAGTYGITVLQDGTVQERSFDYSGGSVLTATTTELSNTVSEGLRKVSLQRGIDVGLEGYFVFPTANTDIDLISASNAGAYVYHGGTNSSTGILTISAIPEPTVAGLAALAACGMCLVRSRRI